MKTSLLVVILLITACNPTTPCGEFIDTVCDVIDSCEQNVHPPPCREYFYSVCKNAHNTFGEPTNMDRAVDTCLYNLENIDTCPLTSDVLLDSCGELLQSEDWR